MRKMQIGAATLYLADAFGIMPKPRQVGSIIPVPPYGQRMHAGAQTLQAGITVLLVDFESFTEEPFAHSAPLRLRLRGAG